MKLLEILVVREGALNLGIRDSEGGQGWCRSFRRCWLPMVGWCLNRVLHNSVLHGKTRDNCAKTIIIIVFCDEFYLDLSGATKPELEESCTELARVGQARPGSVHQSAFEV